MGKLVQKVSVNGMLKWGSRNKKVAGTEAEHKIVHERAIQLKQQWLAHQFNH